MYPFLIKNAFIYISYKNAHFYEKLSNLFFLTNIIAAMICHGVATMMLFYFLQDLWSCEMFWSVFFLCSILPCAIELIMISYSFIMKKWYTVTYYVFLCIEYFLFVQLTVVNIFAKTLRNRIVCLIIIDLRIKVYDNCIYLFTRVSRCVKNKL